MSRVTSTAAVIVAGGTGSRFGHEGGKQLAMLAGRPVAAWALRALGAARGIDPIVLVCHPDAVSEFEALASKPVASGARVVVVPGGATRRESVAAGLAAVPHTADAVIIHDGARPLATTELFERIVRRFAESTADGIVVGHESVDTVKMVEGARVLSTPDRSALWAVQTPQVFSASILRGAHAEAERDGFEGTDDASLVERAGGTIEILEGPRDNIKVTHAEDLVLAEALMKRRLDEGV